MFSQSKIRVAVLRGGQSPEYDMSLKTGASVLQNLPEKYHGIDIFIDKNGIWHLGGLPKSPEKIISQVDVVFNALHGRINDNQNERRIEHILQTHNIPFTGSDFLSSALSENKILSKQVYEKHGLKTPSYTVILDSDDNDLKLGAIFKSFVMPVVVKPSNSGFSIGISIAHTLSELKESIKKAFQYSKTALVEQFIKGKEASCSVVENFRGESVHSLLPVEIRFKKNIKEAEKICPANFSAEEKKKIEELAKAAHHVLGLRHYSRSDFIITSKGNIYIIETDSLPGLSEESSLPISLAAGGATTSYFLDHVLGLALK